MVGFLNFVAYVLILYDKVIRLVVILILGCSLYEPGYSCCYRNSRTGPGSYVGLSDALS